MPSPREKLEQMEADRLQILATVEKEMTCDFGLTIQITGKALRQYGLLEVYERRRGRTIAEDDYDVLALSQAVSFGLIPPFKS